MPSWMVRTHPDFFADLERLSKKELEIFAKKKEKIKQNPLRLKHLAGGKNCYREPILGGVRLIYAVEGTEIWLLAIGKHDAAYVLYGKRLHSLRSVRR